MRSVAKGCSRFSCIAYRPFISLLIELYSPSPPSSETSNLHFQDDEIR